MLKCCNFRQKNLVVQEKCITFALNMLPPLPIEQRNKGELCTLKNMAKIHYTSSQCSSIFSIPSTLVTHSSRNCPTCFTNTIRETLSQYASGRDRKPQHFCCRHCERSEAISLSEDCFASRFRAVRNLYKTCYRNEGMK
jgi:hypothetical protein